VDTEQSTGMRHESTGMHSPDLVLHGDEPGRTNGRVDTEQSQGMRHESKGIMWWHPRRFPPCPHGQGIRHGLNVHSVT